MPTLRVWIPYTQDLTQEVGIIFYKILGEAQKQSGGTVNKVFLDPDRISFHWCTSLKDTLRKLHLIAYAV